MAITRLHEIWNVIDFELPRDEWIPLQSIYSLIESKLQLKPDDFLPSAPKSEEPKWMRNVRNVLQSRKTNGDIAWNKNGKYMIPSSDIVISDDSIVVYQQSKPKFSISEERFRVIQKTREQIGLAGEDWVVDYEKGNLINSGYAELAEKVERISQTNISAGFDVLSYEVGGSEKFIEVKTTALSKLEFFLSSNELDVAREFKHRYWIYFLSEIYGFPKLVKIHNPSVEVGKLFSLTPINFRVQLLGAGSSD
jgi:hypothetical protein